jgi:predicted N-formylglutamate amidohydrolase
VADVDRLVVTCEHGGRVVPRDYARLFAGRQSLLASHRGWDAGALDLARHVAKAFDAPLHAATTTRLLVDLNRSIGHPQLFSEITRPLPRSQRRHIVEHFYRPHRQAVEGDILRRAAGGGRIIHVASHTFTPSLDGVLRRADVAWLYDPRRPGEAAFARAWQRALAQQEPSLRLRRNYPYQGRADGLTASLRRQLSTSAYVGIELEVNQSLLRQRAAWNRLKALLAASLRAALAADTDTDTESAVDRAGARRRSPS